MGKSTYNKIRKILKKWGFWIIILFLVIILLVKYAPQLGMSPFSVAPPSSGVGYGGYAVG